MHIVSESQIVSIALHHVGNKAMEEGLVLSKKYLNTYSKLNDIFIEYFTASFKSDAYFNFFHESDLEMNEVYTYVQRIFDQPEQAFDQSVLLAKHLYEKSLHPKIKGGEFYTVYFEECSLEGKRVEAVGLFKTENKDTFLQVQARGDVFEVEPQQGTNIQKLDKGCLIFNVEADQGFVVAVVDNTNKGAEAQYWVDDFLHIKQRQDDYYKTQTVLSMCKNFVTKDMPQQFEISKADQVDFLNKSVKFFKENESFDMDEFAREVMQQPEVIDRFNSYKIEYQKENEVSINDQFEISNNAVKKQARIFKSIIKLDKNFHIYIHGNRQMIEQGEDEKGKYYKMYFKEES